MFSRMPAKSVGMFVVIAAAAALAGAAAAQEGHPLTGTWYGYYEAGGRKHDLTVIMKWDGRNVTGMINPGPDSRTIRSVVLDITPGKPAPEGQRSTEGIPPVFDVRIEVDAPGAAPGTERMILEGPIENPVAGNRSITGTWTRGGERGTFRIQRL